MTDKQKFMTYDELLAKLDYKNIQTDFSTIHHLKEDLYYSIVNGYKDLFLDKKSPEIYKKGTHFNEIHALFRFDRDVRSVLMQSLIKLEYSLKSSICYSFCQKFGCNTSYLNINNFAHTNKFKRIDSNKHTLVSEFKKVINKNKRKIFLKLPKESQNAIEYNVKKYQHVPLWVLFNYITFGQLYHFYINLDNKLQKEIAKNFTLRERRKSKERITDDSLERYMYFSFKFRNLCAHDNRLYCANVDGTNLYDLIIILKKTMIYTDYTYLLSFIKIYIDGYKTEFKTISMNDILFKMGFPNEWESVFIQ